MRLPTFDLEVLETFVTGIELGTFAKAAHRLGRSTSAVSAQLKKLEDAVGTPILRKDGRGLALTSAGETLLGYARRLLDLNGEAVAAVRGVDLEGAVRLGVQEDFGEGMLTGVLGGFARAYPKVRIEARIARNAELQNLIDAARLDLALAWDSGKATLHREFLGKLPLCWIGATRYEHAAQIDPREPLPLVALEPPCLMRSAATASLDRAGIPWRLAFESSSLSGTLAAVGAGLGVTVRTPVSLSPPLCLLKGLPSLPSVGLLLHRAVGKPTPAVARLAEIVKGHVGELFS